MDIINSELDRMALRPSDVSVLAQLLCSPEPMMFDGGPVRTLERRGFIVKDDAGWSITDLGRLELEARLTPRMPHPSVYHDSLAALQ